MLASRDSKLPWRRSRFYANLFARAVLAGDVQPND